MNRQYSQQLGTSPQTVTYQNQKIIVSPRHQQTIQQKIVTKQYYQTNTNVGSPRIPTPTKRRDQYSGSKVPPFANKIQKRKNSKSKSPKRNVIVSPSPKPDLSRSRQRKIVQVQIKKVNKQTSPSNNSLFERKPNHGPVIENLPRANKIQPPSPCFPIIQQQQKISSATPKNSQTLYCSQQQTTNLIHGKLTKYLNKLSTQKQMLDSNVKQFKQGIQHYYDKLEQRIRSYRRLDFQKISQYQKSCIRYIHEYQGLFNRAMTDVINIKKDYIKNKSSTHTYTISSLEQMLKSYQKEKMIKLFFVHKDILTVASYQHLTPLSNTDNSPKIPSQPLIKFDTHLQVKQVVSDNLIVNNPEFSFINPTGFQSSI